MKLVSLFCIESKLEDEMMDSASVGCMLVNLILFCIRELLMLTSEHWYQMKFFRQSLSGSLVICRYALKFNVTALR